MNNSITAITGIVKRNNNPVSSIEIVLIPKKLAIAGVLIIINWIKQVIIIEKIKNLLFNPGILKQEIPNRYDSDFIYMWNDYRKGI